MPGPRKLWTAPLGVSLREKLIERASKEASTLWLVPSRLAREQYARLISLRTKSIEPPRVWCWEDAWKATTLAQSDPPARLSPSAIIAVLEEAIQRARRSGPPIVLASALDYPGYRRQLLGQFEAWTLIERPPTGPPPGESHVTIEEWSLFGHYRATLANLKAEDAAGWMVWASKALSNQPPPELHKPGQVVVIDPEPRNRAGWRLLDHCQKLARSMIVTLSRDPEPALAELYASIEPVRTQFLGWGFVEEPEPIGGFSFRASGLEAIEQELFRTDSHERPRIRLRGSSGLKIIGGPRGDGVPLMIAREVQEALDRGVPPEEILIVVPALDEDAERIRETLRAWRLPIDPSGTKRLASESPICALRAVLRLPVDDWRTSTLVPLLRNGQIHWDGLDDASQFGRYEAASAIRSTRVFRDRDHLGRALDREVLDPASRNPNARLGLLALDQLSRVIDENIGNGPWPIQVGRVRRIADALGLPSRDLEPLWDSLDDQGWVRANLGSAIAEESWTWAEFVAQLEVTVAALDIPSPGREPGKIRLQSVHDIQGARTKVVILANLAEKTFPTPGSVDLRTSTGTEEVATTPTNLNFSREMLRFARVSASADEQLVLAYPTSDYNGEWLLPAGFLDDLIRRLDDDSAASCLETHARFDPVLAGHPDLARSVADARVLAVAHACSGQGSDQLKALGLASGHVGSLQGTADAFEAAHRRREERVFGPYDGRLVDPAVIARIGAEFGPDHVFSPSQLESFALCPFQFFQRYVLGLNIVDERLELDEDYAGRGNDVHRVLEQIHQQAAAEGASPLIDRLRILIETSMSVELEQHHEEATDLPQVLKEIGTRRTNKTLGRYINQFRSYFEHKDGAPRPHKFEVAFGQDPDPDGPECHPHLTISDGVRSAKLQGKVDRIDLIDRDGQLKFRVIDYKTGSNPAPKDVLSGLATQLPLYALAVERLVFPGGDCTFEDAGYWSLPKEGYRKVKLNDWDGFREQLEAFVLDLVSELRAGSFPIESQKKECRKSCDYQAACRVAEVRMIGKVWAERPKLGPEG